MCHHISTLSVCDSRPQRRWGFGLSNPDRLTNPKPWYHNLIQLAPFYVRVSGVYFIASVSYVTEPLEIRHFTFPFDYKSSLTLKNEAFIVESTDFLEKKKQVQEYGHTPEAMRKTSHYKNEYVWGFVDKWDELIDWDQRAQGEGDFFIRHLKKLGARRVLDVATGTGFHSVRLIEAGFEVVSADGSAEMLAKAFENGYQRGHILRTVQADWRFLNRDVHGEFDAIICLGNSFTHMFNEKDRRRALAEFYAMLKHDGVLILDQRNYDIIIDQGFSSKHTYYYCGDNVKAEPEHIDEGLARFRYEFPDGSIYHLNMFPLRKDYTRRLMSEVGFQHIETYGDFQETYREEEPDFFVHVAEKSYVSEERATS